MREMGLSKMSIVRRECPSCCAAAVPIADV